MKPTALLIGLPSGVERTQLEQGLHFLLVPLAYSCTTAMWHIAAAAEEPSTASNADIVATRSAVQESSAARLPYSLPAGSRFFKITIDFFAITSTAIVSILWRSQMLAGSLVLRLCHAR